MSRRIRMRRRLDEAGLPVSVLKRFELELEQLAQIDGQGFDPDEAALIVRIVGDLPEGTAPAPFESLWRYATDFLASCLMIAVADGRYSVEQARHVSTLASRLGWSAYQLSQIESETLRQLEALGWSRLETYRAFSTAPS